ncbi:MAG: head GIN domain-containing protein [Parafilimonas sp.]
MKIFLSAFLVVAVFTSCFNPLKKTVNGSGTINSTQRSLSSFTEIKCAGSYTVQLTQGSPASVKIETDDNLLPYIVTDVSGNQLNIHTKDDVNLRPSDKIKLTIITDKIESFTLSGSGDVSTTNKLTGGDHLDLSISGSGNMHFDVNTPTVHSNISGTGDIYLTGETKDSKIDIAGNGTYHAEDLKAENATVKIAGSGDAKLFADSTLDINIAGVGNVYYKGNPSITQNIAGSGKIQKME